MWIGPQQLLLQRLLDQPDDLGAQRLRGGPARQRQRLPLVQQQQAAAQRALGQGLGLAVLCVGTGQQALRQRSKGLALRGAGARLVQ